MPSVASFILNHFGSIIWHLFLPVVFAGLGRIFSRLCRIPDLTLFQSAVLGAALMVLIPLIVAGALHPGSLILLYAGLITIGSIAGMVVVYRAVNDGLLKDWPIQHFALLFVFLLFRPVLAACALLNVEDDLTAYFPITSNLLHFGDLRQIFGFRRMASYGGQFALQALSFLSGDITNLPMLEIITFPLFITLFVLSRGVQFRGLRILLPLIIIFVDFGRANFAPHSTPVIFVLGLVEALRRFESKPHESRLCVILAIVAAALAALRANYVPFAVFLIGLWYAMRLIRTPTLRNHLIRESAVTGLLFLLLLTIPAFDLCASSGSFFYPLIRGNENSTFDVWSGRPSLTAQFWASMGDFAWLHFAVLIIYIFMNIRALGIRALALTGFCASFVMAFYAEAIPPDHAFRYVSPLLYALALYPLLEAMQSQPHLNIRQLTKQFIRGKSLVSRWNPIGKLVIDGTALFGAILIMTQSLCAPLRTINGVYLGLMSQNAADWVTVRNIGQFEKRYSNIPAIHGPKALYALASPLQAVTPGTFVTTLDVPGHVAPSDSTRDYSDSRKLLCAWKDIGLTDFVFENPSKSLTWSFYTHEYWKVVVPKFEEHYTFLKRWKLYFRVYFSIIDAILPEADCNPQQTVCVVHLNDIGC